MDLSAERTQRILSVVSLSLALGLIVTGCNETRSAPVSKKPVASETVVVTTPADTKAAQHTNEADSFVAVGGNVRGFDGKGISAARVAISGGGLDGPIFKFTDKTGRFYFENVSKGTLYVVTVRANALVFKTPSQVITVEKEVSDLEFVAEPSAETVAAR